MSTRAETPGREAIRESDVPCLPIWRFLEAIDEEPSIPVNRAAFLWVGQD